MSFQDEFSSTLSKNAILFLNEAVVFINKGIEDRKNNKLRLKEYDSLKNFLKSCRADNDRHIRVKLNSELADFLCVEKVTSYILDYENSENPFEMRRESIKNFIKKYTSVYVSDNKREEVESKAEEIKKTGIKHKDACHVACAIIAGADYFLSTDYRLLKYKTDEIIMMNPTDFIKEMEVD